MACGAELLKAAADVGEQVAAHEVTVRVVDQLEKVEVKESQAHGEIETDGPRQFAAENIVEMARVEEAGSVVGDGELLNARHVARIFNGDGGMIGQDVQEGDCVVVHAIGARIENFDDPIGSLAAEQWHCNH